MKATAIALFLALSTIALGQQILEDWNCSSGTLTAGNPTIVTCPEPHNYTSGTRIAIWNASGGLWPNINSQYTAYLRLNINASSTAPLLVNDTQFFPQSGNFTLFCDNGEQMTASVLDADRLSILARGVNGTTAAPAALETQVWGAASANVSFPVTITSPTTFTIPFNSAGYGSYNGNPIVIQRSSLTYTSSPSPFSNVTIADGVGEVGGVATQSTHTWNIAIPACIGGTFTNQATAFECARGYTDPGNQKGYGGKAQASSLVVTGGMGNR